MINHSTLCRSIKYDYMNSLIWTILKKTQILNGCETFAFKYIWQKLYILTKSHVLSDFSIRHSNENPQDKFYAPISNKKL